MKFRKIYIPIVLIIIAAGIFAGSRLLNKPERKKMSGAMQALQFFTKTRAYPNKDISNDAHYRAFVHSKMALRKMQGSNDAVEPWKLLGPKNVGGRTKAIAINPLNSRNLWAGAASGGLWRSKSAGEGAQAWEYVDTGFPVLGVCTIAINPVDTNNIYIGTGEVYGYQNSTGGIVERMTRGSYGIGLLKSSDGGRTWQKALDWAYFQQRGVQKIVINPLDHNVLYAATTEGTYKSSNAGETWVQVHDVKMAMDIDIDLSDTSRVFVACGDLNSEGAGVYRSQNAGDTWSLLKNGMLDGYSGKVSIDIYPQDPQFVYAHVANSTKTIGIFTSYDGGDSWIRSSNQDIAKYQGWYSQFVEVHRDDPNRVIAAGVDLWKSTDGGYHFDKKSDWSKWYFGVVPVGGTEGPPDYVHADIHDIAVHPDDPNTFYLATDGGIFRSTDFGETFEGLNGGYATTQFYNGFSCAPADSQFAIGGLQDNGTVIYEGNPAWRRAAGGDGCWTAIDPNHPDTVYASYQYLSIIKSVNRGINWRNATDGMIWSQYIPFVAPYLVSPTHSNILYAGADRIYKSTDGASNWISTTEVYALSGDAVISMAISATNPDTVYVATAPNFAKTMILRTIDGGATWEMMAQAEEAGIPNRYPMDLAVNPNDSREVYAAFSGFGTSHLYRSSNAGISWTDIGAGLPDVPTSAVALDPLFPDHIYVGNDLGVYVSTDRGLNWEEWSRGMPTAIVMDLTISPANRALRAATHGNGVWERILVGATGTMVAEAPPAKSTTFQLHQNYPNPFSKSGKNGTTITKIRFDLSRTDDVVLKVYNVLGQEISTLAQGKFQPGRHEIGFEASNLPAGVYPYVLRIGERVLTKKMLVVD